MISTARRQAILYVGFIVVMFCAASSASAGVHFTGSGSWAENHLGLETHTTRMVKGSVAVDLGSYLRLGYSYAEALQHREGHLNEAETAEDDPVYVHFEQDIYQYTHSVDLFAILYAGEIFTPYVFAGIGLKSYKIILEREDRERTEDKFGPIPFPNFGCGLSIALSKSFSLKVSNNWSIGQTQDLEGNSKTVRDSQLDAGITFSL